EIVTHSEYNPHVSHVSFELNSYLYPRDSIYFLNSSDLIVWKYVRGVKVSRNSVVFLPNFAVSLISYMTYFKAFSILCGAYRFAIFLASLAVITFIIFTPFLIYVHYIMLL